MYTLTNQTKLKSILMDLIWQLLSVPYLFSREYEKVLTRSQLYLYWAPCRRPPVVHPSPGVQSQDWGIWDLASFVSDFSKIGWRCHTKQKMFSVLKQIKVCRQSEPGLNHLSVQYRLWKLWSQLSTEFKISTQSHHYLSLGFSFSITKQDRRIWHLKYYLQFR